MIKMTVLRDFRLTDFGKQLKSGEKVEFDDEYFNSSKALKAAINAGWIDKSSKVSDGDSRLMKTEKVMVGKKRTLQAPISDEDKQFQMDVEGTVASPGLKKQAQAAANSAAADATAASLLRAKMRLDRLKNHETPVDFKSEDIADEVVGADIGEKLAIRRQLSVDTENNFRKTREDQAVVKTEAPVLAEVNTNIEPVIVAETTTIKEEVSIRTKRVPRVPRVKKLDKVD